MNKTAVENGKAIFNIVHKVSLKSYLILSKVKIHCSLVKRVRLYTFFNIPWFAGSRLSIFMVTVINKEPPGKSSKEQQAKYYEEAQVQQRLHKQQHPDFHQRQFMYVHCSNMTRDGPDADEAHRLHSLSAGIRGKDECFLLLGQERQKWDRRGQLPQILTVKRDVCGSQHVFRLDYWL